jgi:hypothetical protein
VIEYSPGLLPALLALVDLDERGDPESPLRWTTKSLRNLAEELSRQGHRVCFFFTGPDVPHAIPYGVYDLAGR